MNHEELREQRDDLENDNVKLGRISDIQGRLTDGLEDISNVKSNMINILEGKVELIEKIHELQMNDIRSIIAEAPRSGPATRAFMKILEVIS